MSVVVQVLKNRGETMDAPKAYSGVLKRYQNIEKVGSRPYLILRDEDTGASLLPPLYNYKDIFMRDGGLTVIYRGVERIHGIDVMGNDTHIDYVQEWEVEYCSDTRIHLDIKEHTQGADNIIRE